jgi:penicillin-binding protein 2
MVLVLLAACRPGAQQSSEVLPTLAPSTTPPEYSLDSAQRVASLFLDAWQQGDFEGMHRLTTFASQEATPLAEFRALYEDTHIEMTLQNLHYTPNTLYRESDQVVVFNYNVIFVTDILGEFTDNNRDLHLTPDPSADDWRVAWSRADIFAAMRGGGALRLDKRIPSRANIYDRNGVILADQLGVVVAVSVVKEDIPQFDACVETLVQVLDQPLEIVQAKLDQAGPDWLVEIGSIEAQTWTTSRSRMEQDCKARFSKRSTRQYLEGSLAPHILGHVGYPDESDLPELQRAGFDQDSILGQSGIELTWDETLRGHPGGRLLIVSPNGDSVEVVAENASRPSESLWLTLDSDLQEYVMQVMGETYAGAADAWAPGSRGAAVVVIDVQTGEILALVSWPTFDGNALTPFPAVGRETADLILQSLAKDPRTPQINRATQGQYPSGSVMKTVDSIAVTDSGIYDLEQKFACNPTWQREPNFVRYDWNPNGQGVLTLAQAITRSCNPYFYEVGYQMDQIDPFLLPSYARKLGLGVPTGLQDIPESVGAIPDPDWLREITNGTAVWSVSNSIDMAIGQGFVEVTPLQIARLFSIVANGGTLYRPHLVQKVGLIGDEVSYVVEPEVMDTLELKPGVLDTVREGLCNVTTARAGTASHIFSGSRLLDVGVCGKTGTAQSGTAAQGRLPHAWFAAYAPREVPEIAVAVIVENSGDGSAVAAPIVRRVLEYYFFGTR